MRFGLAILMLALGAGSAPAATSRPNLVVRSVDFGTCRSLGDCWSARVRNIGPRRTKSRTTIRFFISDDDQLSSDDLRASCIIGVPRLNPGRSYEALTCADDLKHRKPGMYVIACVDRGRHVRESNERDNCLASNEPTIHP